MIHILNEGYKTFRICCNVCNCVFIYDTTDLDENRKIVCPTCGKELEHSRAWPYKPRKKKTEGSIDDKLSNGISDRQP